MPDPRYFSIIPLALLRDPALSDTAKLVAAALGAYTNSAGECWPGSVELGKVINKGERMVQYGVAELLAAGYIKQRRRRRQSAVLQWTDNKTGNTLAPLIQPKTRNMDDQDPQHYDSKTRNMIADRTSKGTSNLKERERPKINRSSYERSQRPPQPPPRPPSSPTRLGDLLRDWKLKTDDDGKPPS